MTAPPFFEPGATPGVAPGSKNDLVTVVVCTRDRPVMLDRCLTSLRDAVRPGDEILVVDSASLDPAVAEVAARHGVRMVRAEEPGLCRARNVGWRAASHDLVAYIDDDVTVTPGWAAAMAEALGRDGTAFVTGRVGVPPDQAGAARPVAVLDDPEPRRLANDIGTIGHGANFGAHRDLLARLGGFDELLGTGARFRAGDDGDFFDRAFAAGAIGWYEPAALASHDQWRSRADLVRLDWAYGIGAGARLAKLARSDRRRCRAVAVLIVWRNKLRPIPRALRDGYQLGVVLALVHLGGIVAGFLPALATPVVDGHLRARRRRG
ncbi:MAG: glycosyl transferase family 2 [Acidimicrobiales bacterium]|jgi:glycosyltransferase involved in cell wall biosynthesis|nr:glycosyl transferase family 2 [Acidimicrobiales bacterium]